LLEGGNVAKHDPKLEVYRPVTGIDSRHWADLRQILHATGEFNPNHVGRLFRPINKLRAYVVRQTELRAIHTHCDSKNERGTTHDLAEYLRTRLTVRQPLEYEVKSLPVYRSGLEIPKAEKRLVIAVNEDMLVERALSKMLLQDFYRETDISSDFWQDDGDVTGVLIAQARNADGVHMIEVIENELRANPELLPAHITLGALARVQR
jgi:hypothetical protein